MIAIGLLFVRMLCDFFKPRPRLEAEIRILRHQLNVLQQCTPRRRLHLRWVDRALFIWLYRRKSEQRCVVIVRLTSSSNCRPAFARRRAVAIALRHLRRLRSRSGADFVEQLTDKTERVNLIVVLAGRETQQLGPQVSKPWCALPRRPHGSPYSLAKDTMETAARDHRAKIHITSGCSPDSC
jgi:hypothetical protein